MLQSCSLEVPSGCMSADLLAERASDCIVVGPHAKQLCGKQPACCIVSQLHTDFSSACTLNNYTLHASIALSNLHKWGSHSD